MIDKSSPIPLYHQIEEVIKQGIEHGEYQPGDVLPAERVYAEQYQVSRMTVRQAITNLVNERYLYRIKGKGTFIAEPKLEQNLKGLTSFTEDMSARGMKASSKISKFDIIPANRSLAEQLNVDMHTPIYEIKRVRLAEEIPMALERTYIPANLIKGLSEERVLSSIYKYAEEQMGLKIKSATQTLEATIANKEEIKLLEVDQGGAPVLLMKRTSKLENGQTFEIVKSSYRADRYKFMIDLER
ncbi:transcriptional regulator [Gracilibacillus boraciitolerans JCM 21714]|uniref:Transcriptional regulator n=1 Tax=Gracilibacillus boraciitolerans JCM 21714 TaxID=1298598 RepID=W4VJ77_9BACI|nr:GntR family transcriptional regulator [Gracilibacillus boraciitolerans]GAE93211.1 transcriptional regulator [Gracilibacillus boraciitolerans JCM 21714]